MSNLSRPFVKSTDLCLVGHGLRLCVVGGNPDALLGGELGHGDALQRGHEGGGITSGARHAVHLCAQVGPFKDEKSRVSDLNQPSDKSQFSIPERTKSR